jgi:hypothetical protein
MDAEEPSGILPVYTNDGTLVCIVHVYNSSYLRCVERAKKIAQLISWMEGEQYSGQ